MGNQPNQPSQQTNQANQQPNQPHQPKQQTNQPKQPNKPAEVKAKRKAGQSNPPKANSNAKTLCQKCGKLITGKYSCCGKGGSWQGKCVSEWEITQSVSKQGIHTWAEAIDACKHKAQ